MKVAELKGVFFACIICFTTEQSQAQFEQELAQTGDCGQIIDNGDVRTKVPWVVGIFARHSSRKPFTYFTSGAILDPTTIVTVLGGFYGQTTKDRKYSVPSPDRHMIMAGLKSTSLEDTDEYSQKAEVSYILPHRARDPENRHFHLFLFRLKTPLNLTGPYVRAACIPEFLTSLPTQPFKEHDNAIQGGFGVDQSLTPVPVQLESNEFCNEQYQLNFGGGSTASHVYCGRTLPNVNGQCVSYGSSLSYLYNGRWFLLGLIALHPTQATALNWCHPDTVYFYANFLNATDWILDNLKCSSNEFSCGGRKCIKLDQVCDMKSDCSEEGSGDEDPIFCRARKPCMAGGKTFECGVYGPCVSPSLACDGKRDCPEGEDEAKCTGGGVRISASHLTERPNKPALLQLKEPTTTVNNVTLASRNGVQCPPLQATEGVDIECTDFSGINVPCERPQKMTMAKLKCKRLYTPTSLFTTITMTCNAKGRWRPFKPFACELQCGIRSDKVAQSYIVQGQAAIPDVEPFPWHAAIFAKYGDELAYICGGSLIHKSFVVTAAHCVTDSTGAVQPADNYQLVLGGNSSNFDENQRNENAQIFEVKSITVPLSYDSKTLQGDIALIQLDSDAKYGDLVRPVCSLQRSISSVPEPGTVGKVPGYGFTEEHKISDRLQFANFPVIRREECTASLKKKPPLKTFCAGYKNGTSVCQGDSGSGMVFPDTTGPVEKYTLKGIVSHGDVKAGQLCDENNYAVYTDVDEYADWIIQKLESVGPSRTR